MPARTPEARARERENENARRRAMRVAAKTDDHLAAVIAERDRRAKHLKRERGKPHITVSVTVSIPERAVLTTEAARRGLTLSALIRGAMIRDGLLPE